jgi:hypothetical protein
VAAAGRRDVGEDLAAAAGHEPGEGLGLSADLGRVMFIMLLDSSIMNITASAGGIKVESQYAAGARGRIEDRHRARLVRRLSGQRPGAPDRVSAAAVMRDPDVRRTGERGRDCPPRRPGTLRRFKGVREIFATS